MAGGRLARYVGTRIRSQNVAKATAPPDPAQCIVIERVARGGLAALVGLNVGDRVITIDGAPASDRGPGSPLRGTSWEIYRARANEILQLSTTDLDLGVETWRTGEAMDAQKEISPRELEQLWKRGDWTRLERLARAQLGDRRDDPALALLGAALVELGQTAEGEAMTAEYAREYSSNWTMCYTAIALYYGGQAAVRHGQKALGIELLEAAYRHEAYPRIAEALGRAVGKPAPVAKPRWLGQKFPVRYSLARIDSTSRVELAAELAALTEGQVLLVALMAEQRTNGPYNTFMERYRTFATDLRPFVRGLHVLTSARDRPPNRPDLMKGEDAVKVAGLPLVLLDDVGNAVANAAQPKGVPEVFALDKDGRVLHQGMLEYADLWDALARLDEGGAIEAAAPATERRSSNMRWVALGAALVAIVIALALVRAFKRGGESASVVTVAPSTRAMFEKADVFLVQVTLPTLQAATAVRARSSGVLLQSEFTTAYTYRRVNELTDAGAREVLFITVHVSEGTMTRGSAYQPMSTTQLIEVAKSLPACGGLYLDGNYVKMAELEVLLADLPRKKPAPFDIREVP